MAENTNTAGRQPKKDNSLKWLVIVFLFGIGAWPIALFLLLGWDWLADKSRQRTSAAKARQAQARMDAAISTAAAEQKAEAKGEKAEKPSVFQRLKGALRNGLLLRVVGVLLLLMGLPGAVEEIGWALNGYGVIWDYFLPAVIQTVGGGALFWLGQRQAWMNRRAEKYRRAMGKAEAIPLEELAKRMNVSREKLERELERLIDKEYLTDLYMDREAEYFLYYGARIPKPQKKQEEQAAASPEAARYQEILRKIRGANDRIAGEELSAKIDQLEQITAKILKEITAHPEKGEKLHTFFDYYLPTTLKLLDAYAEFEAAGVEGENLRNAKSRIEATMDGIVEGFAHQLDELYRLDAMDVASDIQVMESMLQRDTASAEKDFDYQKYQQPQ